MCETGLSVWELMAVDPAVPMDRDTLRMVIRDQRRWSRTYVYPWLRVVSRILVTVIVGGKRACRLPFAAHGLMDRLCLWFLRSFVSADAVSLLVRHFLVETNVLNFCLRNALPGVAEVGLRPVTLAGLGDRAVIEHDLNVYRVLSDLGLTGMAGPPDRLDFDMLDTPPVDPEAWRRRLLRLDIQTALCLMNIPFALCLTPEEYRRAVHSLRLDASLLTVLTALTGDDTFLSWRPGLPPVRVDSNVDVPAMVYEHAVRCEYAHARLRRLGSERDDNPLRGSARRHLAACGQVDHVGGFGGRVRARSLWWTVRNRRSSRSAGSAASWGSRLAWHGQRPAARRIVVALAPVHASWSQASACSTWKWRFAGPGLASAIACRGDCDL